MVSSESLTTTPTTTTSEVDFIEGHVTVSKNRGTPFDLYYQLHGNGPNKVILVMGFMTDCTAWRLQLEYFKQLSNEYQVCVFDNRGIGKSSNPASHYTTNDMAIDTKELLDHLQWERVHLVGVSMGGMISLEFAATFPQRLHSIALCVTHAGSLPPMSGMRIMLKTFTIKDHRERGKVLMPVLYSPEYLLTTSDTGRPMEDVLIDDYVERMISTKKPDPSVVVGHLKTVSTHHVSSKRLAAIKNSAVPILIMCGGEDHLVKTSNSFYLRDKLSPAEFIQFAQSGHCINVEHTQEFNEALVKNFGRAAAGLLK
ncbi:hypothetical protein SAMD00019534_022490 [Acytostelium subglobosum LB1]|uniref:hypothetical protein n=1 Tax=Acytostelium subglobosum LB1 TaxID=1410327 RepID=UPI0006451440|nr:hypothetical protein SAMD00019534_022490 [Acytostelium subglobosum LB1]GAM19074.1 hypothetical protein SAMD00019534_022490 [Acytostelium subglobosum LB1]|eukprot:XP_012757001.1 hypothetical protein SAMD00019534_022490 [Acytostelium subglobosum LB1]